MAFSSDEYRQLLASLLPAGKAWQVKSGKNIYDLFQAFADEFAEVDTRSDELREEADPQTTSELLEDWERVLGFPDGCTLVTGTDQERIDNIVNRLKEIGRSLTLSFFEDIADNFGINIIIEEPHPFRLGSSGMGNAIRDPDFQYVWRVYVPSGVDYEQLECIFNDLKPAHTNVFFATA